MFTGIVEEMGTIRQARSRGETMHLEILAPRMAAGLQIGESVSVNGVCLTANSVAGPAWRADATGETLSRSTLARLKGGERVNLERALRLGDRLGGHWVQGHVDAAVPAAGLRREPGGVWLGLEIPPPLQAYVVEKGSIAVDGVSLTVARLRGGLAEAALVPHTLEQTNLGHLAPGDWVNLEVDILAKYVERLLSARGGVPGGTEGGTLDRRKLAEHGFL